MGRDCTGIPCLLVMEIVHFWNLYYAFNSNFKFFLTEMLPSFQGHKRELMKHYCNYNGGQTSSPGLLKLHYGYRELYFCIVLCSYIEHGHLYQKEFGSHFVTQSVLRNRGFKTTIQGFFAPRFLAHSCFQTAFGYDLVLALSIFYNSARIWF